MALLRRATIFLLGLQVALGAYSGPIPGQLTTSPLETHTLGADNCRAACTNLNLCRTYAHDPSDDSCKLYNLRAGLNGISLTDHDTTWDYYETTLGDRDSMLTALNDRRSAVGPNPGTDGYLAFTREPFNMTLTGGTFETVYVGTAGECAAKCLRGRGVIDDATGVRCQSFEFHITASNGGLHRCDLLHEDLLTDGWPWEPNDDVRHYERLIGTGCWVYTEDCYKDPAKGSVYTPGQGNAAAYETACHALARGHHDDECRARKNVPTWAWFSPGGSLSTWNPPDLTEGCVIEAGDCPFTPLGRPEGWAEGTWRDSVGEFDVATFSNARSCMDQAEKWHGLCEKPVSDLVYATYMATGARLGFPVPTCQCDDVGELIDPTTQFSYCILDSSDACKMGDGVTIYTRTEVNDGRPYPEILCEDIEVCTQPDDNLNKCRLLAGVCANGAHHTNGTHSADLDGPTTEQECFDMAETVWSECENYVTDYVDVFWTPTRKMKTYPVMDPIYSSVDAIGSHAYNVPFCEDKEWLNCTSFADAGQARWQTFVAPNQEGTLEENHVRGMGFLWRGEEDAVFTLKLKEDGGFDPTSETTPFVATGTLEVEASSAPIWVTVPLDVVLDPSKVYTAVVQVNGEIAYSTDTDYLEGTGDLVWDYLFILWQHALIPRKPRAFQSPLAAPGDPLNVFQFIFVSMVALLIFAILWHQYKKYRKRKKEMEPLYEKVTDEEILPFHNSTVKSSRSRHDTWRRSLGGRSGRDLNLKPMNSDDESSGELDMSAVDSAASPGGGREPRKSWNMDDDTSEQQQPQFEILTIEQQQARLLEKKKDKSPKEDLGLPRKNTTGADLFVSPANTGLYVSPDAFEAVGPQADLLPPPMEQKHEPKRRSTFGPTVPPPENSPLDTVPPTATEATRALGVPGETEDEVARVGTVHLQYQFESKKVKTESENEESEDPDDWPMGSTARSPSGYAAEL